MAMDKMMFKWIDELTKTSRIFSQLNKPLDQFRKINDFYDKKSEITNTIIDESAKMGGFYNISSSTSILRIIGKHIKRNDYELVDEVYADYYRNQIELLTKSIVKKYSSRGKIISDAFRCHKTGMFTCSIPVFFLQADGIFAKEMGFDKALLFTSNPGQKDKVSKTIKEVYTDNGKKKFTEAFLYPLYNVYDLNKGKDNQSISYNRHNILHGKSVNYDNEINSLKAFSLLNYLVQIFSFLKEKDMEK